MKNFVVIGPSGYIAKRHLQAIQDLGGSVLAYHDIQESAFQGKKNTTKYLDSLESLASFLQKNIIDYLVVYNLGYFLTIGSPTKPPNKRTSSISSFLISLIIFFKS